ncbi:hypothetical protein ACN1T6_003407, partial [Vibrio cholerae]
IRSAIIVIGFFCLVSNFTKDYIVGLLYFSMFCWIFKMIFMILFPSDHVIQREILGFQWKIFFAGDEYLYFGLISACVIFFCDSDADRSRHYKKCFKYCLIALLLALISQRKGAIPYFAITFIMMYFSYNGRLIFNIISNLLLIISSTYMFLFFVFIYPELPLLYQLPFSEYYTLHISAIDSLNNLVKYNPFSGYFGVGAMGLYEIISLPEYADHIFSFGQEVEQTYRYAIWTLPFGRLVLNVGLLGFTLIWFFLIVNIHRFPARFYMYFSIIPLFGMYSVTPVSAIYLGFTLAIFYKYSIRYNTTERQNFDIIRPNNQ